MSRITAPLGIPRRVLEWWPGMIVDLYPPNCRPPGSYASWGCFFSCCNLLLLPTFDIQGLCGSGYPESLMPIFWEQSKSACNFGHFKAYHCGSKISTEILGTLQYSWHFKSWWSGCPNRWFGVFHAWELYMLKCHQMSSSFIKFH